MLRSITMPILVMQVEACDRLGGFLLLQSVAGGTGAGFGTAAAEALRDDYASSFITNHCIWCVLNLLESSRWLKSY